MREILIYWLYGLRTVTIVVAPLLTVYLIWGKEGIGYLLIGFFVLLFLFMIGAVTKDGII